MRHTPSQSNLPPAVLSKNFLQSISPSQAASPSVAQYSAGLAHDARNMLAAMDIYCELLASPGVLKPDDKHLLDELRLLRDSSGKLLDRLLVEALKCLAATDQAQNAGRSRARGSSTAPGNYARATTLEGIEPIAVSPSVALLPALVFDPGDVPGVPPVNDSLSAFNQAAVNQVDEFAVICSARSLPVQEGGKHVTDLATELRATLPMLSALAGPHVHVSLDVAGCPSGELFIPPVDLTRVLINLVRNAAEAMSIGGRILIAAGGASMKCSAPENLTTSMAGETIDTAPAVMISIEDNGPGIPLSLLDRIFDLQVSTATQEESSRPRMPFRPRGLGLRIVREFVEASGGSVRALRLPSRGSRFEIVLPLVTVKVTQVERMI